MSVYLTWIPSDVEGDSGSIPELTKHLSAFAARGPKEAATHAALKLSPHRHPWVVAVSVVRADGLGRTCPNVRRYHVTFSRGVRTLERMAS